MLELPNREERLLEDLTPLEHDSQGQFSSFPPKKNFKPPFSPRANLGSWVLGSNPGQSPSKMLSRALIAAACDVREEGTLGTQLVLVCCSFSRDYIVTLSLL